MDIKGSKTEKNLKEAFAGESMARNKYEFFASKARKEGFEKIAAYFQETADNEKEHAEQWAKLLGEISPKTDENLKSAASGENYEWTDMYKRMAEEAREEGFEDIARKFDLVAKIEKSHEDRFNNIKNVLENGAVFKKDDEIVWRCRKCGNLHFGKTAPEVCPVCGHLQSYQEIQADEI